MGFLKKFNYSKYQTEILSCFIIIFTLTSAMLYGSLGNEKTIGFWNYVKEEVMVRKETPETIFINNFSIAFLGWLTGGVFLIKTLFNTFSLFGLHGMYFSIFSTKYGWGIMEMLGYFLILSSSLNFFSWVLKRLGESLKMKFLDNHSLKKVFFEFCFGTIFLLISAYLEWLVVYK